jgi:hypothetical protein
MNRVTCWLTALLVTFALAAPLRADYLYTISGFPGPTVSGQSIVVFSVNPPSQTPLPGHTTSDVVLANIIGFSANTTGGDSFNTPFTLKLDFTDPSKPGSDATASYAGTLSGKLGSFQASPTGAVSLLFASVAFANPTADINLVGNTYAVTVVPSTTQVTGTGSQQGLSAHIQFTGNVNDVPEPSTLLLAGFAVPLLFVRRLRKRNIAQA